MKNLFIAFEGIDGCGKSTQLCKLHDYLFKKDKKIRILTTREPTYSLYGQKIREMLEQHADPMSEAEEFLKLYVEDRREHNEKIIKPFLKRDAGNVSIILCDRYYYSTIAYQAAQGIEPRKIIEMNRNFARPDIALILDVEPETALKRIGGERKTEKFEKLEFMKRLRENFINLKKMLPDNIVIVDASGTQEETFEKIRKEVEKALS
jgi:dTMP kinase